MAEGIKGTVDWVGYGVGVPAPPNAVGMVGLLDFTGIPVGIPGIVPPGGSDTFYHRRYRRISYR